MDFGSYLRAAREKRGISLRSISASSKIPLSILEALEHNEYARLPGGLFSRSFVRTYAQMVGLDPAEAVRLFIESCPAEADRSASAPGPLPTQQALEFETERRFPWLAVAGLAAIVAAAALGLNGLQGAPGRADEPAAQRPAAMPVAATSGSPGGTLPAPVASTGQSTGRQAAGDPGVRVERGFTLAVHPTGPCWVRATVDGQTVIYRIMQAGEREDFEVRESVDLTIGEAGAFAYSINGHPGRPLGDPGEVVRTRITRAEADRFIAR